MPTYFIRHTRELDIDAVSWQRLWNEHRIALRFPLGADGALREADNASLNPEDHHGTDRKYMRSFTTLAENGGLVCATFHGHRGCVIGSVPQGSGPEIIQGFWSEDGEHHGRPAPIFTLRPEHWTELDHRQSLGVLLGRPKQGTINPWRNVRQRIESIANGIRPEPNLACLTPDHQEVMVSEFLRSTAAEKLGLPRVATLLVPVGRTMQDVDIVGLTEDGTHVYVQVTYRERADAETERKLSILCDLVGQGKKAVLACRGCQQSHEDGVAVVPLETIYEQFTRTDAGTKWLDAVMGWLYPDGLHEGRPIVRG